jgi:hypothetical protein
MSAFNAACCAIVLIIATTKRLTRDRTRVIGSWRSWQSRVSRLVRFGSFSTDSAGAVGGLMSLSAGKRRTGSAPEALRLAEPL